MFQEGSRFPSTSTPDTLHDLRSVPRGLVVALRANFEPPTAKENAPAAHSQTGGLP